MARNGATWTTEQAAAFAAMGRARQAEMRAERAAEKEARKHAPKPEPEPTVNIAASDGPQSVSFADTLIERVRARIDQVDKAFDDTNEPAAIDRLASALAKLADLERVLSGRPLPGARRPGPERAPRAINPGAAPADEPDATTTGSVPLPPSV